MMLTRAMNGAILGRATLDAACAAVCGAQSGALGLSAFQSRTTTVLCVRKDTEVVLMADGQASRGSEVVKPNVEKVRKLAGGVVCGFAGSTADALALLDRLEGRLEEHANQLPRAAVELAKDWRQDKYMRALQAELVVTDNKHTFIINGAGDVLGPHDGVLAIGSGAPYASAAARALIDIEGLTATHIAEKAMKIAADVCVYTNHNFTKVALATDDESTSEQQIEGVSDEGATTKSSGTEETLPTDEEDDTSDEE